LNLYQGNVSAALSAFRTLVDGVVEVHAYNVIHRDIKPANVFVAESGQLVLGDSVLSFSLREATLG
jgi:serine/threonine protein kinase